jgi:hypothetical protein
MTTRAQLLQGCCIDSSSMLRWQPQEQQAATLLAIQQFQMLMLQVALATPAVLQKERATAVLM